MGWEAACDGEVADGEEAACDGEVADGEAVGDGVAVTDGEGDGDAADGTAEDGGLLERGERLGRGVLIAATGLMADCGPGEGDVGRAEAG